MNVKLLALALTLSAALSARADDPKPADPAPAAPSPVVQVGSLTFFRSYEDAFAKAKKEGKLVIVYRMLGDLDGLT